MSDVTWNPLSMIAAQLGTRALYVADGNPGEWYCKPVIVWALMEKMIADDQWHLEESAPPAYRERDIVAMVVDERGGLAQAYDPWSEDGIRFVAILEPGEPMPDPSDLPRWEAAKKRMEQREVWRIEGAPA